jgi:hypothetical protein
MKMKLHQLEGLPSHLQYVITHKILTCPETVYESLNGHVPAQETGRGDLKSLPPFATSMGLHKKCGEESKNQ